MCSNISNSFPDGILSVGVDHSFVRLFEWSVSSSWSFTACLLNRACLPRLNRTYRLHPYTPLTFGGIIGRSVIYSVYSSR